jgi:hypothetical protein
VIQMTSQGTAHGRFQRAINRRHVQAAEMAARELGGLSLADALSLCELLANTDPARYERAALRWLQRFTDERLPPLTEVALAASAHVRLSKPGRAVAGSGQQRGESWVCLELVFRVSTREGAASQPPPLLSCSASTSRPSAIPFFY